MTKSARSLNAAVAYIDSLASFRQPRSGIPGIAIGVTGPEVRYRGAFGARSLKPCNPLSPHSIFRVASHSKSFTATAALLLKDAGNLGLDDPIVRYLPWLSRHRDRRFAAVTIRQLLSHGAGVVRDGTHEDFWGLAAPFPDSEMFRSWVLGASLVLKPDQEMKYSNFGYGLIGEVVSAVSGVPFNNFVMREIIGALKLKDTGPELTRSIESRMVTGYTRAEPGVGHRAIPTIDTAALSPATGFYSTVEDLSRFFSAITLRGGTLLSARTRAEMHETQWRVKHVTTGSEYGLGLCIEYVGGKKLVGHMGAFPGQSTCTLCDPRRGIVVSALTNSIEKNALSIVRGIFGIIDYFADNYRVSPRDNTATRFAGRFRSLWNSIDFLPLDARQVVAVDPTIGWDPFINAPDELEVTSPATLRIRHSSSFGSLGETVTFSFGKHGKASGLRYSASDYFPEAGYAHAIAQRLAKGARQNKGTTRRSKKGRSK